MNPMKPLIAAMALVPAMALVTSGVTAEEEQAKGGFKLGVLTCQSDPDTQKNLVVHSSVQVSCELKYNNGKVEHYTGKSGVAAGVDLNWRRTDVLKYAVLSASQDTTPGAGALAGKFMGGKGSVTLGYGAGAGVLVGGSDTNLTLQPLALEGSKGLGVAAGVSFLTLEHKPAE